MKRIPVLFLIASASLLFFSCKKTIDSIQNGTDTMSESVTHKIKDLDDCRVQQIIRNGCCTMEDTLIFSYNSWGDPSYIKRLPRVSTGAPDYFFKYDNKRRLTDIIGRYNETAAEFWNKYFYENPGNCNIVMDSSFSFVTIKDDIIWSYLYRSVTYFTYDKWGRIIKDSTIQIPGPTHVNYYVYDGNGNLEGRTYDNKVNIHCTNKIWMFYDRDYSLNNPFPAVNYNSSGLPTNFNFSFSDSYFLRFLDYFKSATISYSYGKGLPHS